MIGLLDKKGGTRPIRLIPRHNCIEGKADPPPQQAESVHSSNRNSYLGYLLSKTTHHTLIFVRSSEENNHFTIMKTFAQICLLLAVVALVS